jgi:hypothetical protein
MAAVPANLTPQMADATMSLAQAIMVLVQNPKAFAEAEALHTQQVALTQAEKDERDLAGATVNAAARAKAELPAAQKKLAADIEEHQAAVKKHKLEVVDVYELTMRTLATQIEDSKAKDRAVAARETAVAKRERFVEGRERDIGNREIAVEKREGLVTKRENAQKAIIASAQE